MLLLSIILFCCQSDLLNCNNDVNETVNGPQDLQHNPEDIILKDELGIQDAVVNSSTVPTARDQHETYSNHKIPEDNVMTDPYRDDTLQRDQKKVLKDQRNPLISQNNPYLDNQDYGLPLPYSSPNYSSTDFRLPLLPPSISSVKMPRYGLVVAGNRISVPSSLNQVFGVSTIYSRSTTTTPKSSINLQNLYLTTSKTPDKSKTNSVSTVLNISNTTVSSSHFSLKSTKSSLLRKMLSTRNVFEEIFGKEMANFFALDKIITRAVDVRLPTEEPSSNTYESITESQTEDIKYYTTESLKPIARMQYLPKRKDNATRPQSYFTNPSTPLPYLQYLTTRKKDIKSTTAATEATTNATAVPNLKRAKPVYIPTIPDIDPGILTATAKQEQFFSEDQFGFIHIGTTPAFDPNTLTSILEGRPIYVPSKPTKPTTAGDVLYGEITVRTTTAAPRLHAYHELMETRDEGYMMVFLLELCRLVALKPGQHVQDVLMHTEMIVNEMLGNGRLRWFGRPLVDITLQMAIFITEAEIDVKKSYAAMMYHMLTQRKQELSAEVNSILEYADLMYKHAEGEHLFHVLKEFEEFPNVTLKGYWLCDSLIEAFLRPFRRLKYSPRRQVLVDSINKALKTRFPNYSFRRPTRQKVVNAMENSPDSSETSQVTTTVSETLVTRERRVRLRRGKRKRRKKRKRYYHAHRHRGRTHKHARINQDIVFL